MKDRGLTPRSSGCFFSSRRLHTIWPRDWSSDVCSSDLPLLATPVRNRELFAGKLMTAVLPAVLGTWLGTGIFAIFVAVSHSPYYPSFIFADGDWLFSSRSEERRVGKKCHILSAAACSRH